ncbi:MAG: Ppx/GppA phosphatase family protein [Elusimicrobiales bacterium]
MPASIVAVIDIGSSAIRLAVAEIGGSEGFRPLENLSKPVSLGQDVFSSGKISNETLRESLSVLSAYRDVINGYGKIQVHAVATSAVREAANRDNFIDKVFIRAGIDVEIIEGMEENRLLLMAVEDALSGAVDFQSVNALVMEVGAGATELTLLVKGRVEFSRSLPLGSVRLPQSADIAIRADSSALSRAMKRHLHTMMEDFSREFAPSGVDTFIAAGGDMRAVAREIGGKGGASHYAVARKAYLDFVKNIGKMSVEERARSLSLPYRDAEILYPSMLVYSAFLSETKAETVLVPDASIRAGVMLELAGMACGRRRDLSRQVINSCKGVGRKYRYDEAHALNVTANALKLFDALQKEHGLGPAERLLLEAAGILHDVGTYISPSSHHKHSMYLIDAAEIFGLRKSHKDIVSNVARYHRRSLPKPSHTAYMSLSRTDRTVVAKLAAMLRVADALDNSHQQKFKEIRIEKRDDACVIAFSGDAGDYALEKQSLAGKSDFFLDVYGYPAVLRQERA